MNLQYLDIAIDVEDAYTELIITLFETPAPSLHTVCLRGARYTYCIPSSVDYDYLIEALEARALSGAAPLRHLSVGSSMLKQSRFGQDPKAAYRAVSEMFLEIDERDWIDWL